MSNESDFELVDVWQAASDQDREDARNLWTATGAIPNEELIKERLPQLCVLARSPEGELLAITTAYETFSQRLNNIFFAMRMFVSEDARRTRIGYQLLHEVVRVLEKRFVSGQDRRAIGVLFELENEAIKKARPEAIWPSTGFVYVGNNPRGDHVRVRYFEGATIAP